MLAWMLVAASSMTPINSPIDLIEINNYQPCGEHRFTQVIAYDYLPDYRSHRVQDWKMVDEWAVDRSSKTVRFTSGGQRYIVKYKVLRETWTEHDPERKGLELFEAKYRRKVFYPSGMQ